MRIPVVTSAPDRRRLLMTATAGGAALVAGALLARRAAATPESARALLQTLAKGDYKDGKISLKAPEIAENGNTVPITVMVDSKMEGADRVKKIHVVADGNPLPGVLSMEFGEGSGKVEVQFRIRLAETQKLVAVAEMGDGALYSVTREIKVTIGGCGG